MSTVQLTIRNEQGFASALKSLQRRAIRLGLTPPSYTVLGRRMEEQNVRTLDESGNLIRERMVTIEVADIEVTGPVVRFDGWQFAAKLVPVDSANVVLGPLAERVPAAMHHSGTHCDHCGHDRIRKHTFAVLHEDGRVRQVGSSCLKDFLGGASGAGTAAAFEFAATMHEWLVSFAEREAWMGSQRAATAYSLARVVACAMTLPEYVSWAKAEETGKTPTSKIVRDMLPTFDPSDEALDAAEVIIAEALETITAEDSSYVRNLRQVLTAGYCVKETIGIACSVVPAVERARRDKIRAAAAAASQHVGTIGERRMFRGTVVSRFGYDTDFGWVEKVVFLDAEGNALIANNLPGEVGEVVEMKATVKAHNEFRGQKQTILARPHKPTVVRA